MIAARSVSAALILLATPVALAQMGPDIGKPDPKIIDVAFNGGAPTNFGSVQAAEVTLGMGKQAGGVAPGEACTYNLAVRSHNTGNAMLTAEQVSKLVVAVKATLPDGSVVQSEGKLCFKVADAPYNMGLGCVGSETVMLPAGATVLEWTVDPANQIDQMNEGNLHRLTLKVPNPCTGSGEVALVKPAESSSKPPKRGVDAAREGLANGMHFTRGVRLSSSPKAPARSPRSPSPPKPTSGTPGERNP